MYRLDDGAPVGPITLRCARISPRAHPRQHCRDATPLHHHRADTPARRELAKAYASGEVDAQSSVWMPGMFEWLQLMAAHPALDAALAQWREQGAWSGKVNYTAVQRTWRFMEAVSLPVDGCERLLHCQYPASAMEDPASAPLEVYRHLPAVAAEGPKLVVDSLLVENGATLL